MGPVVGNLATVSDQDVKAIAVYVASLMKLPSEQQRKENNLLVANNNTSSTGSKPQSAGSQTTTAAESSDDKGAVLYASACASCHDAGRPVPYGGINLALSTTVSANDPRNALRVILGGVPAASGARGPIMPGFADTLSDNQVIALAQYIRTRFGQKPQWPDLPDQLQKIRNEAQASTSVTTR
jgi:mono/diheme cytochrome c family protein